MNIMVETGNSMVMAAALLAGSGSQTNVMAETKAKAMEENRLYWRHNAWQDECENAWQQGWDDGECYHDGPYGDHGEGNEQWGAATMNNGQTNELVYQSFVGRFFF